MIDDPRRPAPYSSGSISVRHGVTPSRRAGRRRAEPVAASTSRAQARSALQPTPTPHIGSPLRATCERGEHRTAPRAGACPATGRATAHLTVRVGHRGRRPHLTVDLEVTRCGPRCCGRAPSSLFVASGAPLAGGAVMTFFFVTTVSAFLAYFRRPFWAAAALLLVGQLGALARWRIGDGVSDLDVAARGRSRADAAASCALGVGSAGLGRVRDERLAWLLASGGRWR